MTYHTVAAEDVKIGDQLYMGEKFALNPNHRWGDVKRIRRVPKNLIDGDLIIITAGGCESYFHPKEGVSIQRFN